MKGHAARFEELLQKKRDVKKAAEIPKVKTPKGRNDNQDVDANIEEVKFGKKQGWKVKVMKCFRWFQVSQNHSVSQAYELLIRTVGWRRSGLHLSNRRSWSKA
jgi:hypothetical protein